jgi:hypothetical protein
MKHVRPSVFVAAFLLPFVVAALPLLSIFMDFGSASGEDEALVITDVPAQAPLEEAAADSPLAYGTHDASSSLDCAGESIVAIEG